ncbi:hypothetical protein C8R45DRAFT_871167, partial [Mycena sanguinolenta]
MRALSRILRNNFNIQFVPENSQIRCLAHVVNLVVQKILAVLDEEDDPATRDDYVDSKELPIHYNVDEDPELEALESEIFESVDGAETEEDEAVDMMKALADEFAALTRLQRLRTTVTKICSSPQRRKRFRKAAEEKYQEKLAPSGKKLATLMVVRDVRHRWNYTHAMIRHASLLQDAVDKWVLDRPELRSLYLSPADWSYLKSLGDLLEPFTSVTLQMSRSSTPTLPWVLPMYEKMLTHLRRDTTDVSLGLAAAAGLQKLETYYEKARGCQFNVIATLSSSVDSELKRWWIAFRTYGRGEKNAPLAWWK